VRGETQNWLFSLPLRKRGIEGDLKKLAINQASLNKSP
jgi:hypothetical protein